MPLMFTSSFIPETLCTHSKLLWIASLLNQHVLEIVVL